VRDLGARRKITGCRRFRRDPFVTTFLYGIQNLETCAETLPAREDASHRAKGRPECRSGCRPPQPLTRRTSPVRAGARGLPGGRTQRRPCGTHREQLFCSRFVP